MLDRLVDASNMNPIIIQNTKFKALVNSGSMVTTIAESALEMLENTEVLNLDNFGLDISVADGSKLKYIGYIECVIRVPFLNSVEMSFPVLVVLDTEHSADCPLIIGTNVIRRCKEFVIKQSDKVDVPTEWQVAFQNIQCKKMVIRSMNRKPFKVKPYESAVLNGLSERSRYSEVVSGNLEESDSNFMVCPRIVKKKQQKSNVSKVQIKICNISGLF